MVVYINTVNDVLDIINTIYFLKQLFYFDSDFMNSYRNIMHSHRCKVSWMLRFIIFCLPLMVSIVFGLYIIFCVSSDVWR
jgi:hypothetical protein